MTRRKRPPTDMTPPIAIETGDERGYVFVEPTTVSSDSDVDTTMAASEQLFAMREKDTQPLKPVKEPLPMLSSGTSPHLPTPPGSSMEAVLALVDEYLGRCQDGSSLGLAELAELRARVAKL